MFNLEVLSKKIGFKIANELSLDNEKGEVISYGIFAIIQMVYNILLVILFGAIFGVLIESLIVSFVIAILRKSSGGAHASSPGRCAVSGTFVAIVIGLISKIIVNENAVIFIGIIIVIWSYYVIFKLAPVDSKAKPIKTEKKKQRLKKRSILILSILLVIIIISTSLYLYTNIDKYLIYTKCILGGVIWQTLSLTKMGHSIIKLIDIFLKYVLEGGKKNEKN